MKRNVFLLFLFLACLTSTVAQTDYYYSKGNKNYLTQNTDKVCLSYSKKDTESSEKIKANAQIQCTIYDDSFNIFVISQSDFEKLKAQNFWAETGKSVILTSCYYTENNDEVVVSPYLDVRLKKEGDIDLLDSYAEKYGLHIVKNDLFMPLWYILAVTPETEKSPLECANELYESGCFAEALPDFCSLKSDLIPESGIRAIGIKDTNSSTGIFDLQGRRLLTAPSHGLYIVRSAGGHARVRTTVEAGR